MSLAWHIILNNTSCSSHPRVKGGLISKSFFYFGLNLKKNCQILTEHDPPKEKRLRGVIWHLFWDLSQSKKLSEIKLPLTVGWDEPQHTNYEQWTPNCPDYVSIIHTTYIPNLPTYIHDINQTHSIAQNMY